jgi:biopolymer transport protein ExbB
MHVFFLVLLVIASVVGLAFIIERGLALRWKRVIPPAVEAAVDACRSDGDLPMLSRVCQQNPSPLSRLLLGACDHLEWPKEENVSSLEVKARHEVMKLERGLVVLEIVVGIAPLLGLVGTIYGLILLFGGLGKEGMDDNNRLAEGIALALRATLMGLLTAIPSLVAWSYYNKKVETLTVEMETVCDEFLRRQYRQGGPVDS